jgi:hypothetical protein
VINDRQLEAAIEARRVKVGAANIAISRSVHPGLEWWSATFVDADNACGTKNADTLKDALAEAESQLLRKRAENARRAGVALAYSADWTGQEVGA